MRHLDSASLTLYGVSLTLSKDGGQNKHQHNVKRNSQYWFDAYVLTKNNIDHVTYDQIAYFYLFLRQKWILKKPL